ncbi:cupin domain-containing protein [Pseudomonas mangiferae]|uniref:Cupin domain-containing protein n=1 Tax=Pseudomonas mangiferae TaxID=2593654 RepID=A0A553GV76_9PSED|nr:cupin domain-containing protein [Pseudomonas mangiferae]TRX73389.1 cupin domain-containing protein [Pseudomonas mangiferae]
MDRAEPLIVNLDEAEEELDFEGPHHGSATRRLTPPRNGQRPRLGVRATRVPSGRTACPFHAHAREDEVFYVLSGRGLFRYGEQVREIRAGDCVSCPAGTGIAHQLANPFEDDLVYLSIGPHDPDEVCVYPDSGKVMVRSLGEVGRLHATDYFDGEPERPLILDSRPTRD